MERYYRIQDNRSALPQQSRNYWSNGGEFMDGVSAFGDLLTASRDLLGREDVDGLGGCYTDMITEEGGVAVLSTFYGEDCGDESENVQGWSVDVDLTTERRFTSAQVLNAWKSAIIAEFGDDVDSYTWEQLQGEYELDDFTEDAAALLFKN